MKIAYFWLTSQGKKIVEKIQENLGGKIESKQNFKTSVQEDFKNYDALVFVMATGIVIRVIADLLIAKHKDPAVIVLDQQGKFVISLLSGHLGGANALACQIAEILNAMPVITTATDIENIIAFDIFAKNNNLIIENLENLKYISSAMLEYQKITVYSDFLLQEFDNIIIKNNLPAQVIISDKILEFQAYLEKMLILRPKSLVIGIGCKKNISFENLESCVLELLELKKLSILSVAKIASIKLKQYEPAILKLCETYHLELEIIPDEKIRACKAKFETSEFVEKITGLPSVAEACSYLGSDCGEVLTGKIKFSGITLAICRKKLDKLYFKK